ncbi:MAG: NosD domain-containing protein [Aggregatilineales bacterium]
MLLQNLEIYIHGTQIKVRGCIDHHEYHASENASSALQTAIDTLSENGGGDIYLHPGNYLITEPIKLASNITLRGSNRGTWLSIQCETGLLLDTVDGVTICDLAVTNDGQAKNGIVVDNCGDCVVRDVFCSGFTDYGIWVRNNSFLCELRGCKLADNGKSNLYFDTLAKDGRGGDFVPNLATNCITYGGGTGIETKNAIVLNLIACVVFQPQNIGFHIHSISNSVLISGCRTFQCEQQAVVVDESHEINISSNVFCWHRGDGIVLRNVAWGTITGNEIIDSGVRVRQPPYTIGIVLEGETRGVQVTGNTIFNWGDQVPMRGGIKEEATCHDNILSINNINYYEDFDIISEGKNTQRAANHASIPAFVGLENDGFPDYNRERIQNFIAQLMPKPRKTV